MRGIALLEATLRRAPDARLATLEDVQFMGANILEVVGTAKVSRNVDALLVAIETGEWLKLDITVADSVGRPNVSTFEVKLWVADAVKKASEDRLWVYFYGGFAPATVEGGLRRSA